MNNSETINKKTNGDCRRVVFGDSLFDTPGKLCDVEVGPVLPRKVSSPPYCCLTSSSGGTNDWCKHTTNKQTNKTKYPRTPSFCITNLVPRRPVTFNRVENPFRGDWSSCHARGSCQIICNIIIIGQQVFTEKRKPLRHLTGINTS